MFFIVIFLVFNMRFTRAEVVFALSVPYIMKVMFFKTQIRAAQIIGTQ